MTATAQEVLNVARGQLGVVEGRGNRTPYGKWYPMDGQPWCAIFISWCADQAGALDIIPKHAYTPTGAGWFQARGQYHTESPKVGDIVYYKFPGMGRISHVGIVEQVRPDGVVAIEGNTDEAGGRTGGKVMRKVRRSFIHGYGRPAYGTVARPERRVVGRSAAQTKATQAAVNRKQDGKWGRDTDLGVELVRHALNGNFPHGKKATQQAVGTTQDGRWGPQSRAALKQTVRELQAAWGTAADGAWGPQTEAAWRAARARNYMAW